jgi:hypothetical protein
MKITNRDHQIVIKVKRRLGEDWTLNWVVSEQKRQKDRRSPKASPVRMQERGDEDYDRDDQSMTRLRGGWGRLDIELGGVGAKAPEGQAQSKSFAGSGWPLEIRNPVRQGFVIEAGGFDFELFGCF